MGCKGDWDAVCIYIFAGSIQNPEEEEDKGIKVNLHILLIEVSMYFGSETTKGLCGYFQTSGG